jgi:hypothetical protein
MRAISEKIVEKLPTPAKGNKLHYFSGAKLQGKEAPGGFAVRVTAAGSKSFVWFHRVDGTGHLETLGPWEPKAGGLSTYGAIVKCIERRKAIAKGIDKKGNDVDPRPERTRNLQDANKPAAGNVSGLLDSYIARYLKAGKLRSAGMIEAQLERLVKPQIGKVGIYDLKRSHISRMLDNITEGKARDKKGNLVKGGARMADLVLAYVRKAFNWYEVNGHDDDFTSPVVRGMARLKPSERERERILSDDEIRDVWAALDSPNESPRDSITSRVRRCISFNFSSAEKTMTGPSASTTPPTQSRRPAAIAAASCRASLVFPVPPSPLMMPGSPTGIRFAAIQRRGSIGTPSHCEASKVSKGWMSWPCWFAPKLAIVAPFAGS